MKYRSSIYAKALAEVIAEAKTGDDGRIVKNFLALVERNGDSQHLRKILEEAARFARGTSGVRKVTFESARPLNKSQQASVAGFIRKGDVVEEKIDPSLVAGVKIIVNDERQIDGSLKGKLDKLFGNR